MRRCRSPDLPRCVLASSLSWALIPPSRLLVVDLIRLGSRTASGGLEVDKQQVVSPEVVEAVVGLAHVVVGPHASPCRYSARYLLTLRKAYGVGIISPPHGVYFPGAGPSRITK